MRIILQEDVRRLGKVGDEVNVADGYGRNYLIPKGIALLANSENRRVMKERMRYLRRRLERTRGDAEAVKQKIEGIRLAFTRKVGEGDRLFGSVTSKEIGEELQQKAGVEFDRKKIDLEHPIKTLGETQVPIRLHPEVTATVTVLVEREGPVPGTEEAPKEPKTASEQESKT
jgi:large subunit ribosomal protein L9